MACPKSTTSDAAGEPGADIAARAARLRQHEALTQEIYGISLEELLTLAIGRGWELGLERSEAEYRRGRTDANRAKKGVEKPPHKLTIKTVLMLLELSGQKDVPRFLKAPSRWPAGWPKQSSLRTAYSRQRAEEKPSAASSFVHVRISPRAP